MTTSKPKAYYVLYRLQGAMITRKDLEHIGWLARLELSEEDKEKYTQKLNSVLDYFNELDEVDTENVQPTYHVLPLSNVFREDESGAGCLSQEEALSNAPKKQDGFFKAPRMM
jgi:aspartyl-tRNA(Asn)/glutamyl-tRNA(Gln) amidotransferase subunit C